jgi:hypothetical protein
MTLAELRMACRGQYLGIFDNNEDAVFTNALLNQWLNDAHCELAYTAKLYRATKTLNVSLGANGYSWAGLPADVIEVIPNTVRWTDGGQWYELEYRDEQSLLAGSAPLDGLTNATPRYYFLRAGAEAGQQRAIYLAPGSRTAYANSLRVGCWIYPDPMTDDGENTPAFQPAEHQWLVRQVTLKMAEMDANRGRGNATLELQRLLASDAETKMREAQQQGRRPGPMRVAYEEDW